MTVNSRAKGARGERELAAYFREWGFEAHRGIQTRGGGAEAADVVALPGYHIEAKRQERIEIEKWCHQAERDADTGETPLVIWRRNRQPWRVTYQLDAWMALVFPTLISGLPDPHASPIRSNPGL